MRSKIARDAVVPGGADAKPKADQRTAKRFTTAEELLAELLSAPAVAAVGSVLEAASAASRGATRARAKLLRQLDEVQESLRIGDFPRKIHELLARFREGAAREGLPVAISGRGRPEASFTGLIDAIAPVRANPDYGKYGSVSYGSATYGPMPVSAIVDRALASQHPAVIAILAKQVQAGGCTAKSAKRVLTKRTARTWERKSKRAHK